MERGIHPDESTDARERATDTLKTIVSRGENFSKRKNKCRHEGVPNTKPIFQMMPYLIAVRNVFGGQRMGGGRQVGKKSMG